VKDLLRTLRTSRVARRDAVLGKLNTAQARLADARAELDKALEAARQAHISRKDWLLGKGLAADRAWRLAMMPSVEALFEQRSSAYWAVEAAIKVFENAVQVQRDALNVCERALMRHDEWAAHQKIQDELAQRLDEQNQDDDLAVQSRTSGWNLKIESGSCQ
jgi:leucyl aminopeptidase (aminopeptidase T)